MSIEEEPSMGMHFSMETEMRMEQIIEPRALVHNETVQSDEDQRLMREDQDIILDNPHEVAVRAFVGPSNIGKTTKVNHWARVMENDTQFRDRLRQATGNPNQEFVAVHVSLAMAMEEISKKYGVPKPDLNEEHRKEASDLMTTAIDVTREVFTDHPDLTVGVYLETVGLAAYRDLGTSTLQHVIRLPRSRIFLPRPNAKVETRSRALRNEIPIYIAKPGESEKENEVNDQPQQTIDEWLLSHKLIPGQKLEGREQELLDSVGVEKVWKLQWKDIVKQLRRNHKDIFAYHGRPRFRDFLEDQNTRFAMYEKWSPRRMKELDVADENAAKQVVYLDNDFVEDRDVHMHFGRAHGERIKGRKHHHFPLEVLLEDAPQLKNIDEARQYFEQIMGLK